MLYCFLIHLWCRLICINNVGQLEFLTILIYRWRKRLNSDNPTCTSWKICNLSQFCTKYPISSPITFSQSISYQRSFVYSSLVALLHSYQTQRRYWRESRSNSKFLWHFLYCQCNLNSIFAHNFIKFSFFHASISINKFDIICPAETFLGLSISSDDDNLEEPGYNLVRADNPTNTERGGNCHLLWGCFKTPYHLTKKKKNFCIFFWSLKENAILEISLIWHFIVWDVLLNS